MTGPGWLATWSATIFGRNDLFAQWFVAVVRVYRCFNPRLPSWLEADLFTPCRYERLVSSIFYVRFSRPVDVMEDPVWGCHGRGRHYRCRSQPRLDCFVLRVGCRSLFRFRLCFGPAARPQLSMQALAPACSDKVSVTMDELQQVSSIDSWMKNSVVPKVPRIFRRIPTRCDRSLDCCCILFSLVLCSQREQRRARQQP